MSGSSGILFRRDLAGCLRQERGSLSRRCLTTNEVDDKEDQVKEEDEEAEEEDDDNDRDYRHGLVIAMDPNPMNS